MLLVYVYLFYWSCVSWLVLLGIQFLRLHMWRKTWSVKTKERKKCNYKNRMHIIMYTHNQVFVYPINLLFSWNNHTHKMIFALQMHESTVYSRNERVSNCPVHVHTVPVVASAWFCCGKTPGRPVCSSLGSGQVLYSWEKEETRGQRSAPEEKGKKVKMYYTRGWEVF